MAKTDLKAKSATVKKIKTKKVKSKAKKTVSDEKVSFRNNQTVIVASPTPTNPLEQKTDKTLELKPAVTTGDKYPILKDMNLVEKFLKVPLTNNQKGRIRQNLKDSLKTSKHGMHPDVIHNTIQSILHSSADLSDADLRKVRILYNMLKTVSMQQQINSRPESKLEKPGQKKVIKKTQSEKPVTKIQDEVKKPSKSEGTALNQSPPVGDGAKVKTTPKGVKRYVVFVGNLPKDVTKEMLLQHFSEMASHIKDVRIPKLAEGKKSAIAYIELQNEPSYELALSKHHTMLGRKRIKVLYTTQKNSKITKTKAKSKSAKLIALQKTGQLAGSLPMNRKRSHRRKKQREARAKENQDV